MPHEKKAPDDVLAYLYSQGYSCGAIANICSMTRQAVWERLNRRGAVLRKKAVLPFILYDGIKFTPSGKGYYRATSRGSHISLHRYKYTKEVGAIPPDHDIHHRDGDKQNNKLSNLECISKSDHARYYGSGKNQYNTREKNANNSI